MTRLVMTGADEESYRAATRRSSRVIAFPDGVARHITLADTHWDVFDWLESETSVYTKGAIAARAYSLTLGYCDLDALHRLQPPGWAARARVHFNEAAAARTSGHDRLDAFRDAAEQVTGQARRHFEDLLSEMLCALLRQWGYERMGFRRSQMANDFLGPQSTPNPLFPDEASDPV